MENGSNPAEIQQMQTARRNLDLEEAIAKLDKYHVWILDDLAYVDRVPWNGVARLIIEPSGQGREWVNLRRAS